MDLLKLKREEIKPNTGHYALASLTVLFVFGWKQVVEPKIFLLGASMPFDALAEVEKEITACDLFVVVGS